MASLLFFCAPMQPPYFFISCKSHFLFSSIVQLFDCCSYHHCCKTIYSLELNWTQRCSSTLRPQSVIVGEYACLAFVLVPRKAQHIFLVLRAGYTKNNLQLTVHQSFIGTSPLKRVEMPPVGIFEWAHSITKQYLKRHVWHWTHYCCPSSKERRYKGLHYETLYSFVWIRGKDR